MTRKDKTYKRVIFPPELIKDSVKILESLLPQTHVPIAKTDLDIELTSGEGWSLDNEDEFFGEYRKGCNKARFGKFYGMDEYITFSLYGTDSRVSVSLYSRGEVQKVFEFLDANEKQYRLPILRVFIGHGHDPQWIYLKDHLHDKHGIETETYEVGPRAGIVTKKVIDDILTTSSFAVLVLTGENIDAKGGLHARENVIHELGLFQARLGWEKAIALIEEGVEEFSNIHGLNQIRFHKGNIKETFGEVLATIRREFPQIE